MRFFVTTRLPERSCGRGLTRSLRSRGLQSCRHLGLVPLYAPCQTTVLWATIPVSTDFKGSSRGMVLDMGCSRTGLQPQKYDNVIVRAVTTSDKWEKMDQWHCVYSFVVRCDLQGNWIMIWQRTMPRGIATVRYCNGYGHIALFAGPVDICWLADNDASGKRFRKYVIPTVTHSSENKIHWLLPSDMLPRIPASCCLLARKRACNCPRTHFLRYACLIRGVWWKHIISCLHISCLHISWHYFLQILGTLCAIFTSLNCTVSTLQTMDLISWIVIWKEKLYTRSVSMVGPVKPRSHETHRWKSKITSWSVLPPLCKMAYGIYRQTSSWFAEPSTFMQNLQNESLLGQGQVVW